MKLKTTLEKNIYISKLYTVSATIVRYVPMNNNKLLVGCKLDKEYDEITKMIFSKQGKLLATAKRASYKRDRDALLAQALKKEMEKDEQKNAGKK